ncbi:ABC transporter ATP-binding protein [Pseudofulvimonas gallinarii]|uniref:ABC transporter ATP-binding protein n=1 Tax=Pseudofulvimonas gallinarii TaxID=634155 RepID=UPI0030B8D75F
MDTAMIEARGLGKRVDGPDGALTILEGIDLVLNPGRSLAIVGRSGSGKTTLLSLLAGLDRPTSGRSWLHGHELTGLDEEARAALRRRLVGFVFQSFQLIPTLDALENVMVAADLAGLDDAADRARQALERVGLGTRLRHLPHQMSGGEQQRVALARAFVHAPPILFADEPTGNLDGENARSVTGLLFDLQRDHGTTLVLVTHDPDLAARCDQCLRVADGRSVAPA